VLNPPQTRNEAEAYQYEGSWNKKPSGFNPRHCAYEIVQGAPRQCSFRPGKGPSGLYCGLHAGKAERRETA
jgi:hypothetical protein